MDRLLDGLWTPADHDAYLATLLGGQGPKWEAAVEAVNAWHEEHPHGIDRHLAD